MTEDSKKFQRVKEDFDCEKCGAQVQGTGYTNHCPKCLYSKHVDIFPGDRLAKCASLMAPVGIEEKHGRYRITHQCLVCGYTKINMASAEDDFQAMLALAQTLADQKSK